MRYVTTRPYTIPAGTELHLTADIVEGALSVQLDDDLLMTVFVGRRAALEDGFVVSRPELGVVT